MTVQEIQKATATGFIPATVKTGWDPEVFLVHKGNKHLIPAFTFLPKKEQAKLYEVYKDLGSGMAHNWGGSFYQGTVYADGFAAEFTTTPDYCHARGADMLRQGLWHSLTAARKKFPDAQLTTKSFYRISDAALHKYNIDDILLGCKPSLNAYGAEPFMANDPYAIPYRMTGGHIHFELLSRLNTGGLYQSPARISIINIDKSSIIKWMDLLLALPCVALFDGIDSPLRRRYYGRAGEWRNTSYGIEYRTLSNAWLCHPVIMHLVMEMARFAAGFGYSAQAVKSYPKNISDFGLTEEELQNVINSVDAIRARQWLREYRPFLEHLWAFRLPHKNQIFTLFDLGVPKYLKNWDDIEGHWLIGKHWGGHSNGDKTTWRACGSNLPKLSGEQSVPQPVNT